MTGHQLAQYRTRYKRTQPQVARELGVSQTYLSLLESGKRPVTDKLRKKAVRVFNLSPTEMPAKLTLAELPQVSDDQLFPLSEINALAVIIKDGG